MTFCLSYSNLSASQQSSTCPSAAGYTAVASCPTDNVAGTCNYTVSSGGTNYSYADVFYAVNGMSCAIVKQACSSAGGAGGTTTSFTGGC